MADQLAIQNTGVVPFAADQSMGGFNLKSVADPVAAQDAATKNYVDTAVATRLANSNFVTRETPAGAVDGVNAVFTLAFTPVVGSEEVFENGLLQDAGGNDYSILGSVITFVTPPPVLSKIRVSYRK